MQDYERDEVHGQPHRALILATLLPLAVLGWQENRQRARVSSKDCFHTLC